MTNCNREGVGNFYGLAVVTSGYPGGHRGNHAYGFAVESGMTGANNANVCDAAVFTYHEFNNYAIFELPEPEEIIAPEEVANSQQVTDLLIVQDEEIEEDKQVKNQEDIRENEAQLGTVDITEGVERE